MRTFENTKRWFNLSKKPEIEDANLRKHKEALVNLLKNHRGRV
jgi:hypothetical protein